MTSTVADVSLCLLLVSAGVATVATTDRSAPEPRNSVADATAESLATATTTVTYAWEPTTADGAPERATGDENVSVARTAHGTYAELLADGTAAGATIDGRRLSPRREFDRSVRRAVAAATGSRVQVAAAWEPYPGSHVGCRTVVGPSPPSDADVRTATFAVPSGFPSVRGETRRAARGGAGFDGVARAVADRTVAGLFPPDEARPALHGDYRTARAVRERYRRAARTTNASVAPHLAEGDARGANERLTAALAPAIEAELRAQYDSPAAAADDLRLARVEIAVRTWSA